MKEDALPLIPSQCFKTTVIYFIRLQSFPQGLVMDIMMFYKFAFSFFSLNIIL